MKLNLHDGNNLILKKNYNLTILDSKENLEDEKTKENTFKNKNT
jgi:hypothetical protein